MKKILSSLIVILTVPALQHTIKAQEILGSELVIQGEGCMGRDCGTSESFGSDLLRFKENNLRLHFDDSSNSGSFPFNDWRIIINDDFNGGDSYFMVQDVTASKDVFRLDAGAPAGGLRLWSDGDVTTKEKLGAGTDDPVLSIHARNGNSPGLRMEQDGSDGFTAQTWDIAGNEEGFFVRDVSHASKLPFRIQPNTPDEAVFLKTGVIELNTNGVNLDLKYNADTLSNLIFADAEKARIGIGNNSPEERLDVAGNIKADGFILPTGATNGHVLTSDNEGTATWASLPSIDQTMVEDADQDTKIQVEEGSDDDFIRFDIAGSEAMVLDTAGRLGIGVTEPGEKLDVNGNIKTTGFIMPTGATSGHVLTSDNEGTATWASLPSIDQTMVEDADQDTKVQVEESADEDQIRFDVNGSEAMVIDESGQIGIGADPSEKLEVNGNIKASGLILPTGAGNGLVMTSDAAGNASWTAMPEMTNSLIMDVDEDTKIQIEESADEDHIRFDVAGVEAMIIDDEGNVGIGTNDPEHALHVVGDLGMTGGVYGVSDVRLKKDIASIDNAMSMIRSLEGKTYHFKSEQFTDLNLPEQKQYGLIAQEVEAAISDLVTQRLMVTKDVNGEELILKGVNYEQIIPILINALKEQDAVIAKQQQNLDTLIDILQENNERLTLLEKRIEAAITEDNMVQSGTLSSSGH